MKKVFNFDLFNRAVKSCKYFSEKEIIVIEILQIYNCRISEILESKWINFFPNKFLIIQGKKNSSDIIIRDRILLEKISQLDRYGNDFIFFPVTYPRIKSLLLKNFSHMFNELKTKKNRKITHAFRYLNASNEFTPETNKAILHHNSKTSQNYYIKKKK
jgi:hypothetical protein